ncbi:MAG: hypothetical protein ACE5PV_25175 [Candidatus Poribacteria bacterium]
MTCPYYRQESGKNFGLCTDGRVSAPIPTPSYKTQFCLSSADCRSQCPIYAEIRAREARSEHSGMFKGVFDVVRRSIESFFQGMY